MNRIEDRLVETRNRMNIDELLQKITFFEKSHECLFDNEQIKLLYLHERLSVRESKEQRSKIKIYH